MMPIGQPVILYCCSNNQSPSSPPLSIVASPSQRRKKKRTPLASPHSSVSPTQRLFFVSIITMMWLHQDEESISYDDSIDSTPPPPPPFPPPVARHNSRSTAHIVTRAATVEEELEIRMTPVLERVNRIERVCSKRNIGASKSSDSNPNGINRVQSLRPPLASIDASVANSAETTMGIMNEAHTRAYKPTHASKTYLRSQTAPSSVSTTTNKTNDNNYTRPDSCVSTVISASSLTYYVSVLPEDDRDDNGEGTEAVPTPASSNSITKDSTAKTGGGVGKGISYCCRERRGLLLGISTVLLVLVAVGITGLTMHLKRNKDGITSYKAALAVIKRNLPPETLVAMKSKTTVASSPQKDALLWVLYNDTYFYNNMEAAETTTPIDLKNNEFDEVQFIQRFILATIFMALDGNNWTNKTNWMTGVDVCQWHGIECFGSSSDVEAIANTTNTEGNGIRALILPNNHLHGSLPSEIVGLDKLENMELFNNDIIGSIPPKLFEMTMLKTLFLDENHITGTLSTMIGSLINLEKLTLNRNEIVDSIPNEIGKLSNLSM